MGSVGLDMCVYMVYLQPGWGSLWGPLGGSYKEWTKRTRCFRELKASPLSLSLYIPSTDELDYP